MEKIAFVTVGTTLFDELIKNAVNEEFLQLLDERGYKKLILQIGRGTWPVIKDDHGISIEIYRFKPSLKDDFNNADFIISHAGAGSSIEALEAQKPLIIVVNDKLMNNHQKELAEAFYDKKFCLWCYPHMLCEIFNCFNVNHIAPYEPGKPALLSQYLDAIFRE